MVTLQANCFEHLNVEEEIEQYRIYALLVPNVCVQPVIQRVHNKVLHTYFHSSLAGQLNYYITLDAIKLYKLVARSACKGQRYGTHCLGTSVPNRKITIVAFKLNYINLW